MEDQHKEREEDAADVELYEQAMEEHRKNPVTYSHEEVAQILGENKKSSS